MSSPHIQFFNIGALGTPNRLSTSTSTSTSLDTRHTSSPCLLISPHCHRQRKFQSRSQFYYLKSDFSKIGKPPHGPCNPFRSISPCFRPFSQSPLSSASQLSSVSELLSSLALDYALVNVEHRPGMEDIKIPSPSTILDSPDTAQASARGKPKAASPPKRAKQIATVVQKPKQTKSRNGTIVSI